MKLLAYFFLIFLFVSPNCFCQNPSTGLAAFYPFDGDANDLSGNGNHGIVHNATLTTDRCGNPNSAYFFNGNSYIKVPYSASLNKHNNEFSLSLWIYPLETQISFVCKSSWAGLNLDYRFWVTNNGGASFVCMETEIQPIFTNPIKNQWNHYGFIYQNGTFKIYENGKLIIDQNGIFTPVGQDYSTDLYIGADPHGLIEYMRGAIDDLFIYNRALTDSEILCLYSQKCPRLDTVNICPGTSVTLPNGEIYSEDTVVCNFLTNKSFCDNIVSWHIKKNPNSTIYTYETDFICQNEPYTKYGFNLPPDSTAIVRTSSFRQNLISSQGCDSIVVLELTILPTYTTDISIKECEFYTLGDSIYTKTGTYIHPFQTVNGCDSIINLSLTISEKYDTNVSVISCHPYTWNKQVYTKSGIYAQSFISSQGCDSSVALNLTIPENLFIDIEDTISIGEIYNQYGFDIPQQNSKGYYTFQQKHENQLGCDSITTLHLFVLQPPIDHSVDLDIPNAFTPNRSTNNFFSIGRKRNIHDLTIWIYNRWGEIIYQSSNIDFKWDGRDSKGNFVPIGTYIYLIEYHSETAPAITQQKTGIINIVH